MATKTFEDIIAEGIGSEVKIVASIESIAPGMLMHSAAAMQLQAAWVEKNGGGRKKVIPTPEEEAPWGEYRDADGDLILPAMNMQRSMIEAGKAFKSPARKMATLTREVAAGVIIPAGVESFKLVDAEGVPIREYKIDLRRAVVQRSAIMRARPWVPEWNAEIRLWLDPMTLSPELALQVLMFAGRTVGVGDYRPEKSGPFGRFRVTSFQVLGAE